MNSLTTWNPFREMEELQDRLSSLWSLPASRTNGSKEEAPTVFQWMPIVDIAEDDNGYHIKAELPGIHKEDVKVTVEHGLLNITGERKFEKEENGRKYHRVERAYGNFVRSFTLPDDADDAKVNAEFKDGVLNVTVGKSAKALPKQIEVKFA